VKGFRVCGRKESHAHRGQCAGSRTARGRTKAFRSPWTFGEMMMLFVISGFFGVFMG
jgi:hypothetical protein